MRGLVRSLRAKLLLSTVIFVIFGFSVLGMAQTKQVYQLLMGTGGTAGSYYPLGGGYISNCGF